MSLDGLILGRNTKELLSVTLPRKLFLLLSHCMICFSFLEVGNSCGPDGSFLKRSNLEHSPACTRGTFYMRSYFPQKYDPTHVFYLYVVNILILMASLTKNENTGNLSVRRGKLLFRTFFSREMRGNNGERYTCVKNVHCWQKEAEARFTHPKDRWREEIGDAS